MQAGEEYLEGQCGFPVISLTLKSAKQGEFQVAYDCIKEAIIEEFWRHDYVLESLNERQKKYLTISAMGKIPAQKWQHPLLFYRNV